MERADILKGLSKFLNKYTSQTNLGTFREQTRSSLISDGLGTRANSIWKMAEYIVAYKDDGDDIPKSKYLAGWAELVRVYKDQHLILQIDDAGNWEMYDAYGTLMGGNDFIEDYFARMYANTPKGMNELSTTGGDLPLQVLFYGAPGTGKSYHVDEKIINGQIAYRVTFHPDTDYASFVGCYKPMTISEEIDGNSVKRIGYGFHKQVFLEAYVEAWKVLREGKKVFLVIEEINRGNCAQIFGDIFQLLDRRKDGFSKYTINADSDIAMVLTEIPDYQEMFLNFYPFKGSSWHGNLMALPSNLNIIATMNTSDQSLFQMDSAFKRRWETEYFPIDYDDANSAKVVLSSSVEYKWGDVLRVLNYFIKKETDSANKTIGNRFVDFEKTDNIINFKTFRDKVIFFLFNDVFKDNDDFAKAFFGERYSEDCRFFEDLCESNDFSIAVNFLQSIDYKKILVNIHDDGENSAEEQETE